MGNNLIGEFPMPTAALLAVALWAALNTFILIWLSFGIGKLRTDLKVSIGDGGEPRLIRAMRGQANFTENVPMTLLLLLLMAMMGTPAWVVHIFGAVLTFGRAVHAAHFLAADAPGWQRVTGALCTALVQLLAAVGLIGHAVLQMGAA